MSLFPASVNLLQQKKNQFLPYKLNKIIKIIKKLKTCIKEEGLDNRLASEIIFGSLKWEESDRSLKDINVHQIAQYIVGKISKEGNTFAVSLLRNLNQEYKQLRKRLLDQSSSNESQQLIFLRQKNIKLQQKFPSQISAPQKQVKLQQQALQHNQNTFQKQTLKQKHRTILQKLEKRKKYVQKYLEHKLHKSKTEQRRQRQDQEQCNRKYGPKVQMEKHNYRQIQQVKKLRLRLLGDDKQNKKNSSKKKQIKLFKKFRSHVENTNYFEEKIEIRQISN